MTDWYAILRLRLHLLTKRCWWANAWASFIFYFTVHRVTLMYRFSLVSGIEGKRQITLARERSRDTSNALLAYLGYPGVRA